MPRRTPRAAARLLAATVASCAIIAGCAVDATAPNTGARLNTEPTSPPPARSLVCKEGPAGAYSFTVTNDRGTMEELNGRMLVSNPFVVNAGACVEFYEGGWPEDGLWISEDPMPEGSTVTLEFIVIQKLGGDCAVETYYCPDTVYDIATRKVYITPNVLHAYKVTFHNAGEEPPPGIQGCTPGYWKQPQHFGNWVGYQTTDSWNAVFGRNFFTDGRSLLTSLSTGGGGMDRFGRHTVAALLNASQSGVEYGMTVSQVIAAVQAAVDDGSYDMLSDRLEIMNESDCPLGLPQ